MNSCLGKDNGGEAVRMNVSMWVLACGFVGGNSVGTDSKSERIEACVAESMARRMHLEDVIRLRRRGKRKNIDH